MKYKLSQLVLVSILFFSLATPALATEANLKCTPASGTYKVGETFTVDYVLDTRGFQVFGSDIEATYDTSVISAQATTSTAVTATTGWSAPVSNTVDAALGKISMDYGQSQSAYTGSGSIGKITFKGVAAGQAQFNFVFYQQYDNTTPGVAKVWGKKDGVTLSNILTEVNNCIFVIEAAPTAGPTAPPAATNAPGPTRVIPTELPRAGVETATVDLLGLGLSLIVGGGSLPFILRRIRG